MHIPTLHNNVTKTARINHVNAKNYQFLNQACAVRRLAHAWFLKIDPVWIIGMRVHVCVRVQGY